MPVRVSPADRIRDHIDELFAQDRSLPEMLEEVARLGAQLLMQAALEAEVTEFLGRDRYQRAAASGDARPGSRNGYREVTVKSTAGPVTLARPKLRGTSETFASRLSGAHVTKTNALESLVIASFVRGLPVRDVEAALAEALGIRRRSPSPPCRQSASRSRKSMSGGLPAVWMTSPWTTCSWTRPSSGCTPAPRPSRCSPPGASPPAASPRSSAWPPGTGESADAWTAFLADLKDRGLASPLLVISDGAPGLIGAIEQACPKALRQRCLIHRCRNILAKIPAGMQPEVKDAYWKIFGTGDMKTPPGPRLVEIINARVSEMAGRYAPTYPSAMKALTTDAAGLTAYLRFPAEHHHRVRHSSFIERTFGETPPHQGHRPAPRRDQLPHPHLGRPGPGLGRLARPQHDLRRPAAPAGPAPFPARPAHPAAATHRHHQPARRR